MIVITGGAGFIGSNLAAALDERGERVVVCDWLDNADKWRNISKCALEYIIRPEHLFEFLENHAENIEAIFHMGAISTTTETDADLIVSSNVTLSQRLWSWCAQNGANFIYASSAATYGDGAAGFNDASDKASLAKLQPLNPYGWSKHFFDRWVVRKIGFNEDSPRQWAGLKFFNVYGPNEYHKGGQKSVAEQIYATAANNETFELFKSHNPDYQNGGQMRDFIWVGDCVNVMLWLLEHPKVSGLFNLGTGQARSFIDLANAVYRAADQEPKIAFRDMPITLRDKYQYFTQADMDKLRQAGYIAPFTSLENGVDQYVKNYLATADKYR